MLGCSRYIVDWSFLWIMGLVIMFRWVGFYSFYVMSCFTSRCCWHDVLSHLAWVIYRFYFSLSLLFCLSHMLRWGLWVGVRYVSCECSCWGLVGGGCLRDLGNCSWLGTCGGFLFLSCLLGSFYGRSFGLASFCFLWVSSILFSFLSRLSFVWSRFSFWLAHLQWFHFLFFVSY